MVRFMCIPLGLFLFVFNCNQVNPSQPVTTSIGVGVMAFCVSGPYLFAGTDNDGIFRSTDNGENWTAVNSGLTPAPLGRRNTCVCSFAVSGSNIFAGTGYDQGIFLSTDNGENWKPVNSGLPIQYPLTELFIHALIVRGNCIFAGTDCEGIYLSTNNGKSWTDVSSGLSSYASSGYTWKNRVTSFAECGSDLFTGTYGGVFRLTHNDNDGTIKWTAVSSGLESDGKYVTKLAVSGSNIFAATLVGVFLSTDNGASWESISSGLTDPIITSVFVSGNRLFASTQWDTFLSTNNGASWTMIKSGLHNQFVTTFFQSGNTIFAGTAAGGVFRSTDNGTSWTAVNSGLNARWSY